MLFSAAIVSIRPSTCSRFGSTHHLSRPPSAFHDERVSSRRKRCRGSASCRRLLNVRGGSDEEEEGQDDDGSEILLEAQSQADGSGDDSASDTPVIDVSIINGTGDYDTAQEEESSSEEEGTTEMSEESVTNNDAAEPVATESEEHDSQTIDEDDQREESESSEDLSEIIGDLQYRASGRRAEGKELHDAGNLSEAAAAFHAAATLLDEAIEVQQIADSEADESVSLERATCRLHEALCLLKDGRPEECIAACSDVLQDGVRVVTTAEEGDGADPDGPESAETTTKVVVEPEAASKRRDNLPPQIRARALHRRAKARLAVDDLDGALEDARSAAFMGDRNAVQFYGRLMREGSGAAPEGTDGGGAPSLFGLMPDPSSSSTANPFLEGLMGSGGFPAAPPGGDFSASLLSSLLSGDGGSDGPFGLMGDLLSPPVEETGRGRRRGKSRKRNGGGGGGMDTLAKSVLSNLLKKIEDEETQEKICSYLRSTNAQQIMSFAAMAGMPLGEESAERLASFANGVTPRGIGKSVSRVKKGVSIVKTVRRVLKVVDKYKSLIVLAVLCYWIRMAVLDKSSYGKKAAGAKVVQQAAFGLLALPKRGWIRQYGGLRLTSDDDGLDGGSSGPGGIEEEVERLQNQLTLIEAIEERNRAQLGSFVDEQDQWDSLDEEEREFLSSKESIVARMESLSEELVLLFMGQKMKNG